MPTSICRHIRLNGSRCGSPALRDQRLCYFHNRAATRHRALQPAPSEPVTLHPLPKDALDRAQHEPLVAEYYGLARQSAPLQLDFPPLEDATSIQLAISLLLNAMAQDRIDPARATRILYGLQVASANCRSLPPTPSWTVTQTVLDESGMELAPDEDPEVSPFTAALLSAIEKEEDDAHEDDEKEDDEAEDDEISEATRL